MPYVTLGVFISHLHAYVYHHPMKQCIHIMLCTVCREIIAFVNFSGAASFFVQLFIDRRMPIKRNFRRYRQRRLLMVTKATPLLDH
jgi:hypothetical protein